MILLFLGCGSNEQKCEEKVDTFLNNYCESVELATENMLVVPSLTSQEMIVPV